MLICIILQFSFVLFKAINKKFRSCILLEMEILCSRITDSRKHFQYHFWENITSGLIIFCYLLTNSSKQSCDSIIDESNIIGKIWHGLYLEILFLYTIDLFTNLNESFIRIVLQGSETRESKSISWSIRSEFKQIEIFNSYVEKIKNFRVLLAHNPVYISSSSL